MITDEKDRLECLKLALTLYAPHQQKPSFDKAAAAVIAAADAFQKYISGASANRIGHGNSTSDSEGSNPSALASHRRVA